MGLDARRIRTKHTSSGLILGALAALIAGVTMLTPGAAEGQRRGRTDQGVPPGHLPPPGECRVWYDDRAPGHRPPPSSCRTARIDAARTGGRVIYGGGERRDERYGRDRDRDPYPDRDRYPDDRYPATLPEMIWGVIFGRGERVSEVREWVGDGDVRMRYTDKDRNGRPEEVTWRDARGGVIQRWIDDRDGRADRVAVYRNGRVVRVIR